MSVSAETKKGYLFFVFLLAVGGAFLLFRGKGAGGADLLEAVPRDAVVVAHVSDVVALGERMEAATRGLGVDRTVGRFRDNVNRQLGFDPLDPVALRERGIRPEAGLAVYAPPPGRDGVAVVSIRDVGTFEESLLSLVGARTGAERGEDQDVDGVTVHVAEARGRPIVAWTYRGDVAILSGGRDAVARVASGASDAKGTVRDHLWFQRGSAAVGEGAQVLLWFDGDGASNVLRHAKDAFEAAAVGITLEEQGASARIWTGLGGTRRSAVEPFAVEADAKDLLHRLDPEAFAAGRVKLDPTAAWNLLRMAGLPRPLEELSAQLTARGVRLERDVLSLVEGTLVMDLGMEGAPDLSGLRRVDPRRLNPFLYVKTTVLAPLTDPEKAETLMPQVAQSVARAARGRLEEIEVEGRPAWEIHYRLGKGMTFGIVDGTLVVAGGETAYQDAARRIGGGGEGLAGRIDDPAVLDRIATEGALALLVHVPNLVDAVEGLPSASFGGGPTGMMLRSMVERFLAPVSRLTRVTATFSVAEGGLVGHLDVGYEPAEAPGP